MMTKLIFTILLATFTTVSAVQQHSPLVAWRTTNNLTPTKLHVPTLTSDAFISTLTDSHLWDNHHMCALTDDKVKIVLILQHNVHAADMFDRPNTFTLVKNSYEQATTGIEVPHFTITNTKSTNTDSVEDQMKDLFVSYIADMKEPCLGFTIDKSVISTNLPDLGIDDDSNHPDPVMHESALTHVQQLMDQHKEALFIYIGIPTAQLNNFALLQQQANPVSQLQADNELINISSLSYIAIYQIFSPALFMSFSVFILLLLIILVGMSWLASIKVPTGGHNAMKRPKSKTS